MWTFLYFYHAHTHRCHMLSRGRPFVFQGALGKKSFDAIQEEGVKKKKKKKGTGTFHWSCPPSLQIKPMCIREEGTLSDIKAPGRCCASPSEKSRAKVQLPVQPAPSSPRLTNTSSFILPTFHLPGNHSRLGRNGRYSSHFDLARGSSYYSLIALTDDSWMW